MRIFVLIILLICGCLATVMIKFNKEDMIYGVSLVNPPREITPDRMKEVKRINAGWVAVIPYGFSRSGQPQVSFDNSNQWWGERIHGSCKLIEYAKFHGFKVMLKPHVWVMGEGWTGDFSLESEEQWKNWEKNYATYILNYAKIADSMNVELLCIGTEYRIPAKERPDFWISLIKNVRNIYSGKITYAANWDNYEYLNWWDAVDYIGIDAYFPLVEEEYPSIEKIKQGWEPIKDQLYSFSKKWDKPILFTEYGFQSINGTTGKHWELDKSVENANPDLQADAYEATYQTLVGEPWFKGGFLWKWHFMLNPNVWYSTQWTPQGKPAEKVIAKWYGKIN